MICKINIYFIALICIFLVQVDSCFSQEKNFPYEFDSAKELLQHCIKQDKKISEIIFEDEKALREESKIHSELLRIWHTMFECAYIGCHTEGILPGGLNVKRRAYDIHNIDFFN